MSVVRYFINVYPKTSIVFAGFAGYSLYKLNERYHHKTEEIRKTIDPSVTAAADEKQIAHQMMLERYRNKRVENGFVKSAEKETRRKQAMAKLRDEAWNYDGNGNAKIFSKEKEEMIRASDPW